MFAQICVAGFVRCGIQMPTAVEFDDELRFDAGEIGDEWADRMLPSETETAELAAAKVKPEMRFGWRQRVAQAAGELTLASLRMIVAPFETAIPSGLPAAFPRSAGRAPAFASPACGGSCPTGLKEASFALLLHLRGKRGTEVRR